MIDDSVPRSPGPPDTARWTPSYSAPPLHAGEVHVWRVDLDREQEWNSSHFALLDEVEQAKARSFAFLHLRERYVAAHGALRSLLGDYLGLEPASLSFGVNQYGKPSLCFPADSALQFNISHSESLALFAFTHHRSVGVDVERMRPEVATLDLARTCFSPAEVAAWRSLRQEDQSYAFFQCWSRKEAYIKVRGMGLSMPLDSFDVSLHPQEPCRLLRVADEPEGPHHWALHPLFPGREFAGALAVEGESPRIQLWDWSSA